MKESMDEFREWSLPWETNLFTKPLSICSYKDRWGMINKNLEGNPWEIYEGIVQWTPEEIFRLMAEENVEQIADTTFLENLDDFSSDS